MNLINVRNALVQKYGFCDLGVCYHYEIHGIIDNKLITVGRRDWEKVFVRIYPFGELLDRMYKSEGVFSQEELLREIEKGLKVVE